jgi:putative spermidine/putrescine transport system permease protein
MTRAAPLSRALLVLSGVLLIVWLILPLLPLLLWSFARGWRFPDLLPQEWSLQAWDFAFSEGSGVLASIGVTLLVAALATLLSLLVGVPAGRALGLYRFRGRRIVEMIVLAPVIVPGIAVALGLNAVFLGIGLAGTLAGVVLVHLIPTLPYMILVTAGVFANHDTAHEAQARSLGATAWQAFRHVTLPAVLPGIMVGALFAFLVSWGQYVLTLMIGGGRVITLPLLLFNFAAAGRNDVAGAIGLIHVLPAMLILVFTARRLSLPDVVVGGRAGP